MKTFRSLKEVESFPNPVLTIGNYDGIHYGHRRIIERVKEKASELSGVSMLMTFDPHPLKILNPAKLKGLITPFYVKQSLLEACGIDILIALPFDEELRQIEPERFIDEILVGALKIKWLVVGYDFKFGKDGRGTTEMLTMLSEKKGFGFEVVDAITIDGEKVGSNRIRKLIFNGEVKKAGRFLERPYSIEGRVVRGFERGKGIGFPTINVKTDFEVIPKEGVYITEVEFDKRRYPSVTNIGNNPTFNNREVTIETHILDFNGNIYDKDVKIFFLDRIRDEEKFDSIESLKGRIALDIETARVYFKKT
ncbi:MAG: bifunctional riboflavin kinase/FAD synthetase [Syntrophorhabdaceae bacterium]|nr:bifunctional riboflavin kinase/FAD synthetase [Syntrophorhabdaceae bacterium]